MNNTNLATTVSEKIMKGFSEKGNNAFVRDDLGEIQFFSKVDDEHYFKFSFNSSNSPQFDCGIVKLTDDQLREHIKIELDGWACIKCQLDDIKMIGNYISTDY